MVPPVCGEPLERQAHYISLAPLPSFLCIRLTWGPCRKESRLSSECRTLHHSCTLSIIVHRRRVKTFLAMSIDGMGEQHLSKPYPAISYQEGYDRLDALEWCDTHSECLVLPAVPQTRETKLILPRHLRMHIKESTAVDLCHH